MNLKQRWREFRAWQREPIRYDDEGQAPRHCVNCDKEYTGNYCPRCGQKAGVGRVNWSTVKSGVMLIWGMDSRSLPYTLLQLVLRPGYLISDYISGKRQVSFPPVKMLLLVAIAYALLYSLAEWMAAPVAAKPVKDGVDELLMAYVQWVEHNPGWGFMTITMFYIVPTWLLFRHAPRHARHTLPEGFFIQVFMTTLILIVSCVGIFISDLILWAVFIYYVIAYKQLFGYGWWGTLWRIVMCLVMVLVTLGIVLDVAEMIFVPQQVMHIQAKFLAGYAVIALVTTGLLWGSYAIGRYTERKRLQKQA